MQQPQAGTRTTRSQTRAADRNQMQQEQQAEPPQPGAEALTILQRLDNPDLRLHLSDALAAAWDDPSYGSIPFWTFPASPAAADTPARETLVRVNQDRVLAKHDPPLLRPHGTDSSKKKLMSDLACTDTAFEKLRAECERLIGGMLAPANKSLSVNDRASFYQTLVFPRGLVDDAFGAIPEPHRDEKAAFLFYRFIRFVVKNVRPEGGGENRVRPPRRVDLDDYPLKRELEALKRRQDEMEEREREREGMISQLAVKQADQGEVLKEHDEKLKEHGKELKEHGKVLKEHGDKLKEHGKELKEHGEVLKEHGEVLKEHDQTITAVSRTQNRLLAPPLHLAKSRFALAARSLDKACINLTFPSPGLALLGDPNSDSQRTVTSMLNTPAEIAAFAATYSPSNVDDPVIIILRGYTRAGKSTLARQLAAHFMNAGWGLESVHEHLASEGGRLLYPSIHLNQQQHPLSTETLLAAIANLQTTSNTGTHNSSRRHTRYAFSASDFTLHLSLLDLCGHENINTVRFAKETNKPQSTWTNNPTTLAKKNATMTKPINDSVDRIGSILKQHFTTGNRGVLGKVDANVARRQSPVTEEGELAWLKELEKKCVVFVWCVDVSDAVSVRAGLKELAGWGAFH